MGDEIVVRRAVQDDTGRILELLKASLGEGTIPREPAYWNWKHRSSPFGVSPALIAEYDGRLVGLRAFMRWAWTMDGLEKQAVRAVDTATHPDWQGRGIFRRLTLALVDDMKKEGLAFIFNTPNRFSRPGYLKMGWSSMGRASLLVRPLRPIRVLRALALGGGNGRGSGLPARFGLVTDDFGVERQLARSELVRLLHRRHNDDRLSTRLSRDYLEWRYSRVPGFEYSAIGSWTEGEEALIFFRTFVRKGLNELRFCDVLVTPGHRGVRQAARLVRSAVRAIGPDYAVAMGTRGTPERRALTLAGFLPAPRIGPILTVRPLDESTDPRLMHWSGWRASIGDLELF